MLYQWSDGSIHRVPPPTQEELATISIQFAHRALFKEGKIEFTPIDHFPPQDVPSMVEFTQEMSIEDAKKRWPNTPVEGEESK